MEQAEIFTSQSTNNQTYERKDLIEALVELFDTLEENIDRDIIDRDEYGSIETFCEKFLDNVDDMRAR